MGETKFDLDDASLLRVMAGLRSVLRGATDTQTRENVGTAAIDIIKERTQEAHRDSTEGALKPYSARYAKAKGVGASQVDLTLTGQMFGSLVRKVEGKDSVRLFFSNDFAAAKAERHHLGIGRNPERRFFAVGEEPAEIILFETIIASAVQIQTNILRSVFL